MTALGAIRSWFTEERGRGYRLHFRAVGRFTRGGSWLRWHTRIGLLWFGVSISSRLQRPFRNCRALTAKHLRPHLGNVARGPWLIAARVRHSASKYPAPGS